MYNHCMTIFLYMIHKNCTKQIITLHKHLANSMNRVHFGVPWLFKSIKALTQKADGRPSANIEPSLNVSWPSFCGVFCTVCTSWTLSGVFWTIEHVTLPEHSNAQILNLSCLKLKKWSAWLIFNGNVANVSTFEWRV